MTTDTQLTYLHVPRVYMACRLLRKGTRACHRPFCEHHPWVVLYLITRSAVPALLGSSQSLNFLELHHGLHGEPWNLKMTLHFGGGTEALGKAINKAQVWFTVATLRGSSQLMDVDGEIPELMVPAQGYDTTAEIKDRAWTVWHWISHEWWRYRAHEEPRPGRDVIVSRKSRAIWGQGHWNWAACASGKLDTLLQMLSVCCNNK